MTVCEDRPALPVPEFPYPLGSAQSGCVRWSCPQGCGWHHDEWPGREPGKIVIPAGVETDGRTVAEVLAACDPADLDRALTASAAAREEARYLRVRTALDEHARTAHSDHGMGADSCARPETPPSANSSAPPDSPPSAGRCACPGRPR